MVKIAVFFVFLLSGATAFAEEQPVCVVKSQVQLRAGPGPKFAVTKTVERNMPLMRLSSKNSWVEVRDFEGARAWVPRTAVSGRVSCVVVKTNRARLRKGPGTEFALVESDRADRSSSYKKTGREGEWIQIQDARRTTYWIHETNVWIPMTRMRMAF